MSEAIDMQPKHTAVRGVATDVKVLAHIERWMATIREINRESITSREPLRS